MQRSRLHWPIFFSGPAAFALLVTLGSAQDWFWKIAILGGLLAWMGIWWLTEVVPMAVTSLLPLLVFPLSGLLSAKEIAPVYMKDEIFLFIGGFFVAFAMEAWGLHQRIAIGIIRRTGFTLGRVLLGFMLATWFLSMWMSNTAATLVMVPTALGIIANLREALPDAVRARFSSSLLIGVGFSATLGGLATLVGTVPNLIFAGMASQLPGEVEPVSFAQWFLFGFPLSLIMLVLCYLILKTFSTPRGVSSITVMRAVVKASRGQSRMVWEEKAIAAALGLMVVLWVFRQPIDLGFISVPGWSEWFASPDMVRDSTVAMFISVILFLIPSTTRKGETILTWDHARKLPFDILLLFGGGFALAQGFDDPQVKQWMQGSFDWLGDWSPAVVVIIVCFAITFFSELTSNITATQLSLPVLAVLAPVLGVHPYYLMVPATLSASFGFMLPIATPPNTIVYGTGLVSSKEMKRAGFILDIAGPLILMAILFLYGYSVIGL